jgi:carboxyl-terminal processing protease
LSLNEKQRKQEMEQADKQRLDRINLRQASLGKEPFAALSDVPKDYETPDAYLNESVSIMVDMLKI